MDMGTRELKLGREADGYYRTSWYDDVGGRHRKAFGKRRDPALNQFNRFRAQWLADWSIRNPDGASDILTISQAWAKYRQYAESYYRHPDGRPTGEAANLADAVRGLVDTHGSVRVCDVGPKLLAEVRQGMIDEDLALSTINARTNRIRRMFRWLVAEELCPAAVLHGLQALPALRPGRSEARVTDPVGPAPEAHVWAVCARLPAILRAMVTVQYWCGCRPGELVRIRPIDVQTGGKAWLYRPAGHKNAYRGTTRVVVMGPRAQSALSPYLQRDLAAWCFSPREARRERDAVCETHRHQPVEKPATARRVGERYTTNTYAQAIRRACEDLELPVWSPNQLRHNALTRLRREGLDVAQVVAGHARADVTQMYADLDLRKAVEAMVKYG